MIFALEFLLARPQLDQPQTLSQRGLANEDAFCSTKSDLVGSAVEQSELLIDQIREGQGNIAATVSKGVEACRILRVISLLNLDIWDLYYLIFSQLSNELSRCEALPTSRVHFQGAV